MIYFKYPPQKRHLLPKVANAPLIALLIHIHKIRRVMAWEVIPANTSQEICIKKASIILAI